MISIDDQREIFIRYFLKYNKIRYISRELGISRNTVRKIITNLQVRIEVLNLQNELDLLPFIDSIVIQPERTQRVVSRYKVKESHMELIKKLVIQNERQRVLNRTYSKNALELYHDFFEKNGEPREDVFSYYTFYNLVKEIKKTLAD